MRDLTDRHVLVTGASRGLGATLANHLGEVGARLTLVARGAEALEAVAERLRARGATVAVISADLGTEGGPAEVAQAAEAALGPVDVVVHNAGVEPFHALGDCPPSLLDTTLAVNVRAPIQLTRALLPGWLARGRGHAVFIASTSGYVSSPWAATYGASKAALVVFGHSLRAELADEGIGVSVVSPGFVRDTGMFVDARGGRRLEPPAWLGSTTSAEVAKAVIDAIRHDRAEVVVNPGPTRLVFALARLTPGLADRVVARALGPLMRGLARADR